MRKLAIFHSLRPTTTTTTTTWNTTVGLCVSVSLQTIDKFKNVYRKYYASESCVCVYNSARLARSLALLHIMYVNEMYALSLCVHVYIRRCVCCVYTRSALSGSMNGVFGGFGGGWWGWLLARRRLNLRNKSLRSISFNCKRCHGGVGFSRWSAMVARMTGEKSAA